MNPTGNLFGAEKYIRNCYTDAAVASFLFSAMYVAGFVTLSIVVHGTKLLYRDIKDLLNDAQGNLVRGSG
ncbi:MAG: hypothetical protein ACTSXS_00485 [Candidatus Thorarchaeota archaeon]